MSRCARCVFYSPVNETQGECRESPPKVFMVPVRSIQGEGFGFQPIFPQVTGDIWCGAFLDVDGNIEDVEMVDKS